MKFTQLYEEKGTLTGRADNTPFKATLISMHGYRGWLVKGDLSLTFALNRYCFGHRYGTFDLK